VAALPVVDVLLAALLLLGEELHPAKPMATATIAITAPLRAAVRFIALAPVDRASPRDKLSAPSRSSVDRQDLGASLVFSGLGRMLASMSEIDAGHSANEFPHGAQGLLD
jgi:hypothetical protein